MRCLLLAVLLLGTSATGAAAQVCAGSLLATIGSDGQVTAGSREAVLTAAREGAPLRVGWEVGRPGEPPLVVHWQDARFITVFEGEVYAQLGGDRQTPRFGDGEITLDPGSWGSLLDTRGRLVTRVAERPEPVIMGVRGHWCHTT
jgi:hypothetical protein